MGPKAYSEFASPSELAVGATRSDVADGLTTGTSSKPFVGDSTSAREASVGAAWTIQPHTTQTAMAVTTELRFRILFFSCCAATV